MPFARARRAPGGCGGSPGLPSRMTTLIELREVRKTLSGGLLERERKLAPEPLSFASDPHSTGAAAAKPEQLLVPRTCQRRSKFRQNLE